ncbi:MAG: cadmium-translocating P-type ATPase [Acholeplasmatales bacterium]|nr:cadmium-translocating P-type ATPase [Acholeplasmatales bacterium]
MTKENKILIIRLIISTLLWVAGIIIQYNVPKEFSYETIFLSIFIVSYLIAGYDVLFKAVKNILSGNLLDEYFLMSIASIGAFLIRLFGDYEYIEAVAVMIFFQVGEVFEEIAVERSKNAIMATMNLKVNKVTLDSGEVIDSEDVKVGDIIVVKPGEMVAVDGYALNATTLDTSSLTGESVGSEISEGDYVLSGSINQKNPLKLKVDKEYFNSTAAKIIDMVENATMRKAKSEKFISKFAHFYTPIVVGLALCLAIIPPLIIGLINGFTTELWNGYIYVALVCLVVSCPCALVVSVPLTYFAGIGANARNKIIVKGGVTLETLSKVNKIVLDKTGTLTKASFKVNKVFGDNDEVLKIAKGLEKNSTHPLAKAINELDIEGYEFEIEETPGYGIIGNKDNIRYICGSKKLLELYNIKPIEIDEPGSVLYICKNDECIGCITLEDVIKDEAYDAIMDLQNAGKEVYLLSGDTKKSVENVADKLNITNYRYQLLPQDKVKEVENLLDKDKKVLFVGDGINDAPVLSLADVGVSMGQVGSDAAIEASDVIVLNDNLDTLPTMLNIAKKTKRLVYENIIISLGIKVFILIMCIISNLPMFKDFKLPMWVAIFGDVGVLIIVILNSMRALFYKNKHEKMDN